MLKKMFFLSEQKIGKPIDLINLACLFAFSSLYFFKECYVNCIDHEQLVVSPHYSLANSCYLNILSPKWIGRDAKNTCPGGFMVCLMNTYQ